MNLTILLPKVGGWNPILLHCPHIHVTIKIKKTSEIFPSVGWSLPRKKNTKNFQNIKSNSQIETHHRQSLLFWWDNYIMLPWSSMINWILFKNSKASPSVVIIRALWHRMAINRLIVLLTAWPLNGDFPPDPSGMQRLHHLRGWYPLVTLHKGKCMASSTWQNWLY